MPKDNTEVLTNFVVNNPDLEHLESLLAQFNIFEAIGAVRQELRHSDFLAYLLDPSGNHNLGDAFLKRLLKRILVKTVNPPVSAVEIDVMHLDGAIIRREWQRIDILVADEENHFVCVIENKIDSSEHGNQLRSYKDTVILHFPGYKIVYIFLTPEGIEPSEEAYLPMSYLLLANILEELIAARESTLGPDVQTLIQHYVAMLRRHIVSESQIAELCRKLYRQHKQALDLIFEYRPDLQYEIYDYLLGVITAYEESEGLVSDHSSKTYVRFSVADWDKIPAQKASTGWLPSDRTMVFELRNRSERLSIVLVVGPASMPIRKAAIGTFQEYPKLFREAKGQLGSKWKSVYVKRVLNKSDYQDGDLESIKVKISKAMKNFLERDLPAIKEVVAQIEWPKV